MELRSTGNPDTSNPVTMSMLEYLSSKGCESMSTKQTNGDKIRRMNDTELTDFLFSIYTEKITDYGFVRHILGNSFEYPFEVLDWLKQPVED